MELMDVLDPLLLKKCCKSIETTNTTLVIEVSAPIK